VFAVLACKPLLVGLVVFILVVVISRYVSLGSLLATLSFLFFIYLFKEEPEIIRLSLAIFLLIVFRHWGNIGRLVKGQERRIGENSK
jgi:glycerol-3-phosphate acyltransferase PlsY